MMITHSFQMDCHFWAITQFTIVKNDMNFLEIHIFFLPNHEPTLGYLEKKRLKCENIDTDF